MPDHAMFYLRYLEAALNSLDGNDGKDIAFQKLWRTRGGEIKRVKRTMRGKNAPTPIVCSSMFKQFSLIMFPILFGHESQVSKV